jgi:GNAT superfamily N-acetyltransferase
MEDLDFIVQREMLSENLIAEMSKLFEVHYQEVARLDLYTKINPDWPFYFKAQENGVFFIYTARLPESHELVGYWWFFVRNNPHYKHVLQAADDMVFVKKEYRGKRVFKFGEKCLDFLKQMGVQVAVVHHKIDHDLEKFYSGLGFEPYEKNYIRSL